MATEIDPLAGPDGGEKGLRLAKFWRSQIEKVRDDTRNKRWIKRGQTIEKRYRDERSRGGDADDAQQRRYNSLWANVQILTPAIYGRCPVPVAERRFKDKDPIGRGAAQILERALRNEIEICGFDEAISQAVGDYLLPGRGVVWVRYEPKFEEGLSVVTEGNLDVTDSQGNIEPDKDGDHYEDIPTDPTQDVNDIQPDGESYSENSIEKVRQTGNRIIRESTPVDYIHWEDFFAFPVNARVWREVTAVGKRVYMTREQMKRRFGPIIGKAVPLKKDNRSTGVYDGGDGDPEDKAEIFEIWSLTTREVFWVAEGCDYLLDRKDDPLKLDKFFPMPKPIFANTTNGTIYPVADYIEYQDQAIQIDELTQRIALLTRACKVAGVYNAAAKDIQRLLDESVENELIPVDDWAAFAEKGGVAGNISLLPLKEIIGVLNELILIKEKCVVEMDRLTGITDIMRGTTDARETLGGQRLKSNSAGTRLQRRQNEVARFCRDVVTIISEIMSQHFSDESLIEASGAMYEEGLGWIDPINVEPEQSQSQSPMLGHNGGPPMGQPPLGMPPPGMPPQMGGGMPNPMMNGQTGPLPPPQFSNLTQAPPPQIPPELLAKAEGIKRILDSIKLIRDEKLRGFRVDIEVDSTIFGDAQQEKGDRTQFITAVTGYLQQAMMMSAQVPEITPLLGKLLQFGVRGFRVGRDLEAAIEDFCDDATGLAKKRAAQAKAQPNPQLMTAQAHLIKAESTAKAAEARTQHDQARLQLDTATSVQEVQSQEREDASEMQRQHIENEGERANNEADLIGKQMDMRMKEMAIQLEAMRIQFQQLKLSQMAMKPMKDAGNESVN